MAAVRGFKLVLTGFLLATASITALVGARSPVATPSDTETIAIADIPSPGSQTYALIARGGPFPYERDGTAFGNRERLLPIRNRGYYREYTVNTPGLGHRGTRRIVCGGMPRTPDSCYYTADHYASFRRIVP